MYVNLDNTAKLTYLETLGDKIKSLLTILHNTPLVALTSSQAANLQQVLAGRLPGLVAETDRNEQVWLEGVMKTDSDWRVIAAPDKLASEAQLVNFMMTMTRDIDHQLFLLGGSERLMTVVVALHDIRRTHFQQVAEKATVELMAGAVKRALLKANVELDFDPHHLGYLQTCMDCATTLKELTLTLNNALYHLNLELLSIRKKQQVKAGVTKTGGELNTDDN